jgi:hypothetical protein
MRTRTAPGLSRVCNEGRRTGTVAGLVLPVEIVQQDKLQACGVPDSSNNATGMPRTGLDGAPAFAMGSAEYGFTP